MPYCSHALPLAVSTRPPQVSRLNLGGSSSKEEAAAPRRLSGGGAAAGTRPPMAKLNLSKLQRPGEGEQENRTPLSARVSAAGAGAAGAGSGGATPRSARRTSPGSSTNWLKDASDSEGEEAAPDCSPAGIAAAAPAPPADATDDPAFQIAMSPPRPLSSRGPPPQRPAGVPRLGLGAASQRQQQQPAAARASAPGAAAGRRLSQARSRQPWGMRCARLPPATFPPAGEDAALFKLTSSCCPRLESSRRPAARASLCPRPRPPLPWRSAPPAAA